MKWGAHVSVALGVVAILSGELLRSLPVPATPLALALVFVGGMLAAGLSAVLPDVVDFVLKMFHVPHRNWGTHGLPSTFLPVLSSIGAWWVLVVRFEVPELVVLPVTLGHFLGWGTHLLLDALTPNGIPVGGRKRSWHWANYDSPAANRVLKVAGGTCLLAGVFVFVDPVYPLFFPLLVLLWASRWTGDRVKASVVLSREKKQRL